MNRFLQYLKPYIPRMSLGLLIKFAGTIMDLFLPWILANMIDKIVPQKNIPLIFLYGVMMIVCSVVAVATNIIANRMASKVAANTTENIRHDLFKKISYLSSSQIDGFSIPSLISRLTSDTYNVHQMVGMMQRLGVRAPILLLGGIIVTLSLDPVLTLVLIAVLPFIGVAVYLISKKSIPLYQNLQKSVDTLVRTVRENITGVRVIKALSKTDYEKDRFAGVNTEVVAREVKADMTMAVTNPLMNLLLNLGLTLVIIVGAFRVSEGLSQPGKIMAFLTYFTIILNAMLSITRMFVLFSKGSASFLRIRAVLEAKEDLVLQADSILSESAVPSGDDTVHIAFEHVCFSYHRGQGDSEILSDIDFQLKKGETLGIIGATGSGKSTVIKLLMRFYDADQGRILINGKDIRGLSGSALHTKFGVVFQNDILFADTIEGNIRFGRDIPLDKINASAVHAQADDFVSAFSDGYGHPLTKKGSNLSGGQKQRLLISRALAGNPEILILDDASSALDYKTDSLFRKALHRHFAVTTKIIIAQRISSIYHADHIMVLEDGRMIGYGTHEELLQSCEAYREISRLQIGGDMDEEE